MDRLQDFEENKTREYYVMPNVQQRISWIFRKKYKSFLRKIWIIIPKVCARYQSAVNLQIILRLAADISLTVVTSTAFMQRNEWLPTPAQGDVA